MHRLCVASVLDNSQILDYLESELRGFILRCFSSVENWENACLPPEIRTDAADRLKREQNLANILNKPQYSLMDYVNFDAYMRIIMRRDNWRNHFERVFVARNIFEYKMTVIQSLRNDVRHGRRLNRINEIRLRLHCYDILAQIYEIEKPKTFRHSYLAKKLGL